MDSTSLMDLKNSNLLEDKLEYYENQMMCFFIQDWDNHRNSFSLMDASFFRNENYLLYKVLKGINVDNVSIDLDYLKLYLQANKNEISLETDRIEFEIFETQDYSGLKGVMLATIQRFGEYLKKENLLEPDFPTTFQKFKEIFVRLDLADILQETPVIFEEPLRHKGRLYKGTAGAMEYLEKRLGSVKSAMGGGESYTLKNSREYYQSVAKDREYQVLGAIPDVPTFDKAMRGIKTNMLYFMVAPEKGMKTKFSCKLTHTVMLNGRNCMYWGKEGGDLKVYSELRAIHFNHYYNEVRKKGFTPISGQDIMENNFPDDNYRELERISQMDLFENDQYGQLITPDYPFMYENVELVIKDSKKQFNCKFFVIDYLQILESSTIHDVRIMLRNVASRLESLKGELNVAIWCPVQMSTDAIQAMGRDQKRELRNVVAESSDITKSGDVNFMLYTNAELDRRKLGILKHLPSRTFDFFEDINVYKDTICDTIVELDQLKDSEED